MKGFEFHFLVCSLSMNINLENSIFKLFFSIIEDFLGVVFCGGESHINFSESSVNGRLDDEGYLIFHVATQTLVPSIEEPIFKQDIRGPVANMQLEESMQDCHVDEQGKYLNIGGSCINECEEGKTLTIYDDTEGFCCCS